MASTSAIRWSRSPRSALRRSITSARGARGSRSPAPRPAGGRGHARRSRSSPRRRRGVATPATNATFGRSGSRVARVAGVEVTRGEQVAEVGQRSRSRRTASRSARGDQLGEVAEVGSASRSARSALRRSACYAVTTAGRSRSRSAVGSRSRRTASGPRSALRRSTARRTRRRA
jgi:hypothetical protein